MFPPLYETVKGVAAVKAIFGNSPRIYPHGEAPAPDAAGYVLPYVVFQTVSGVPANYLGQVPDSDDFRTQIDVYASTVAGARNGAKAIRDALEPVAHLVGYNGDSRDPDTQNFRYSFDVDWITPR